MEESVDRFEAGALSRSPVPSLHEPRPVGSSRFRRATREHKRVRHMVPGGDWADELAVNLVVNMAIGQGVRHVTAQSEGSPVLAGSSMG